jgi:hypothetical protein
MTDANVDRARQSALPQSLPPRGLSRVQASEYIGVSASTFDKLVAEQVMPAAKKVRGRMIWDRKRLDECFDAIDDEAGNPWDD